MLTPQADTQHHKMDKDKYIVKLSGKYSKKALTRLEELDLLTPDIRKIVLDSFADYAREIETIQNSE